MIGALNMTIDSNLKAGRGPTTRDAPATAACGLSGGLVGVGISLPLRAQAPAAFDNPAESSGHCQGFDSLPTMHWITRSEMTLDLRVPKDVFDVLPAVKSCVGALVQI